MNKNKGVLISFEGSYSKDGDNIKFSVTIPDPDLIDGIFESKIMSVNLFTRDMPIGGGSISSILENAFVLIKSALIYRITSKSE